VRAREFGSPSLLLLGAGVLGWVLRFEFAGGGRAGAMTQWGVLTASTMHAQHSATRTRTRSPTSTTALPASRTTMHP
jgi:hypothetical protein